MTDYRAVIESEGVLPEGLSPQDAVDELSELLRSPDPVIRDDLAYMALLSIIPTLESSLRHRLGDTMARRLTDPEIQARTYGPLVLVLLVEAGEFDPSWLDALEAWYPAERDLRGHDARLGWLHAIAHGADALGAIGLRRSDVPPERILALAAKRLLMPTEYALHNQEDDRLAHALALTLTRDELTEQTSTAWLEPIAADFAKLDPAQPVPAHASNTMRTLRVLYIFADRGVRPTTEGAAPIQVRHREFVKQRLAEVLATVTAFSG